MFNKLKSKHLVEIIPIGLIVLITPLIVYLKEVPLTGAAYELWTGDIENGDFFSYYKGKALILFTLMAIFIFIRVLRRDELKVKRTSLYIPLSFYMILVILSAVFSKYPAIALWGFPDRYEGMVILLTYVAVLFITINIVNKEIQYKFLLSLILISSVIIGMIAVFQIFGHNFFNTEIGKRLITPPGYLNNHNLSFPLGLNAAYSTLYNNDYMGSYMAIIFPICFSMFLGADKKIKKTLLGILTVFMFVVWLGSMSRAGILGGLLGIILALLLNRRKIKTNLIYIGFIFLFFAVVFGVTNAMNNKSLSNRIDSLKQELKNIIYSNNNQSEFKSITTDNNELIIQTTTDKLIVEYTNQSFVFKNKYNNVVGISKEAYNYKINDPAFKAFTFNISQMGNDYNLKFSSENYTLDFDAGNQGIKYIDFKGHKVDLEQVQSYGFENDMHFASERGYIWSRTIPLMKHTLILGFGPDCFAAYFPQYDIAGKLNSYNTADIIVDKPHNMYLQTIINTGFISFAALLSLFIGYIVSSLRSFKVFSKGRFTKYNSYIFPGIVGYLAAAFFNDSVVSVAPVFWVLLGLGVSSYLNENL